MAACACILRGTGGRPQEAVLLRKSYIKPNITVHGERNGFNIIAADELPATFPRMTVDTRFYRKAIFE